MEEITGKKLVYYSVDLLNKDALKEVFSKVSYIIYLPARNIDTHVIDFDTILFTDVHNVISIIRQTVTECVVPGNIHIPVQMKITGSFLGRGRGRGRGGHERKSSPLEGMDIFLK